MRSVSFPFRRFTVSRILLISGFALMISLSSCYYDNEEELYEHVQTIQCDTTNVTYSATIKPIMQENCNSCHNQAGPSGGVATDTYAGLQAITAAGLNDKLWGAVAHVNGFSPMPQGGNKLSDCNLAKIRVWINGGALNN